VFRAVRPYSWRQYDAGKLWPLIYDANRDKLEHQDRIYVGQTLRIPNALPAENEAAAEWNIYTHHG